MSDLLPWLEASVEETEGLTSCWTLDRLKLSLRVGRVSRGRRKAADVGNSPRSEGDRGSNAKVFGGRGRGAEEERCACAGRSVAGGLLRLSQANGISRGSGVWFKDIVQSFLPLACMLFSQGNKDKQ